jgi:hypothetical protein
MHINNNKQQDMSVSVQFVTHTLETETLLFLMLL